MEAFKTSLRGNTKKGAVARTIAALEPTAEEMILVEQSFRKKTIAYKDVLLFMNLYEKRLSNVS